MEADVRRGEWTDPGLGRVTFAEWADEYLRTIVHLRAVTQGNYERALRVHVLPTFDTIPVARIDHVEIRRTCRIAARAGVSRWFLAGFRRPYERVFLTYT
jgi:hypothetical protein